MHRCISSAILLLALCVSVGTAPAASAPHAVVAPDFAAIDAYIEARMREQRIPGLALAIVQGDRIVHLKGFGVANPGGAPVTAQTPFSIGSLTKSFTAVAIMQRVEAGQLDLDAPVQRYLPWFRVADPEASSRITLRHLLNHASGLPRDIETQDGGATDEGSDALEQRLRSLSTVELEQPVGTYGYSNVGYQVLGMVIQQVTGQAYEAYVSQHIFAPIGMSQSFASLPEATQHHMATGYRYWFGLPVASGLPPYRTGPGNGGLFSSAEDMAHYLIAHLNNGRYGDTALLSPTGIADVHRPAVQRPDGYYAMGWGVRTTNGITTLSHSGQTYNYFAKMTLVPDSQWGVVILQNSQYMLKLLTGDYSQDAIADDVTNMLIGQQPPGRPANTTLLLIYGVLFLLIVLQVLGIGRSVVALRRGRARPEPHPWGKWGIARQVVVPLGLSLAWAALTLVGMPLAVGQVTQVAYQIPDLTYTLLASGVIALVWGIIRAVWVSFALRKTGAANAAKMPSVQG